MQQRVQGRVGHEPHVPAAPAVAAGRAAARHELLAPEGRHAVAAAAAAHLDFDPVDEHFRGSQPSAVSIQLKPIRSQPFLKADC
jgi:hypothetical protein